MNATLDNIERAAEARRQHSGFKRAAMRHHAGATMGSKPGVRRRAGGRRRTRNGGFTMVEIAIAVAVIAFALVAVVGLLPLGMETQRDNREETIIMHDGTYLLEAIRSGARNADELGRFVDEVNGMRMTNPPSLEVVRELSRVNRTNTALVRTITGAASTRSDALRDFTMRYQVISQVFPANVDTNLLPHAEALRPHLYEVRLALYWPVMPNGIVADTARRQVFRTMVSGQVDTNGFLDTSRFEAP